MTATLPDSTSTGDHATTSFLPADARERLEPKLREAVSEFVDSPAEAVEKADRLLAETVEQLHQALVHRHGELRSAWNGKEATGSARSAGGTERTRHDEGTRHDDGAGFGDGKGFGDGTPSGAGTGLRDDRTDLTGGRADLGGDRADLGGDRADLTGDRDRTGSARDADRDGTADDRAGLAGATSARKPGGTTGAETEAGHRVPGDERTASRAGHGAEADTERLRLALQEYRETTERLLNL
ncbi:MULTISPECIES: translation initiation factor IF-2 [unclassified Streptomyces]|uniref:translation initiation factor IF-2 n=1 Tax=unclassified Streptomyces TaxID=2593676 RepID=UPI000BAC53DB|nr:MULTISPECIES: translation initiation factor IF-2 [unclassified Streptomyces]ASY35220.1 translation initiation factor IF-2 [Streptomyces sp. CLI2509]MYX24609.1 translation initiation factor IF-2 [Streptomyces sp. SID8380]